MGLGEWVIAFFGCLLIGLFVFIIVKESRNYREIKAEDVQAIKSDKNVQKPHVEFFDATAIKKRIHVYYVSEINIPVSEIQHWIMFQFEDGTKKEFLVPQELFEKTSENQAGVLVTVNGNFFDFGDGEDVE